MIIGISFFVPLIKSLTFIWTPLNWFIWNFYKRKNKLNNIDVKEENGSLLFQSHYYSFLGVSIKIVVKTFFVLVLVIFVFSLQLNSNLLYLFPLAIIYCIIKLSPVKLSILKKAKPIILHIIYYFMFIIGVSIVGTWMVNWHGLISKRSNIEIKYNNKKGLLFNYDYEIPNLSLNQRLDTLEILINNYDTLNFSVNIIEDFSENFGISNYKDESSRLSRLVIFPKGRKIDNDKDDSLIIEVIYYGSIGNMPYYLGFTYICFGVFIISAQSIVLLLFSLFLIYLWRQLKKDSFLE